MAIEIEDVRRIEKILTTAAQLPTVAPSSDHTDGSWGITDIYPGEICINTADKKLYSSDGATIFEIMAGIPTLDDVLTAGNVAINDIVLQVGFELIYNTGLFTGGLASNLLTNFRNWSLPDIDGDLVVMPQINGTADWIVFYGATGITGDSTFRFEQGVPYDSVSIFTGTVLKFKQDSGIIFLGNDTEYAGYIHSTDAGNLGGTVVLFGEDNVTVPNGIALSYSGGANDFIKFTKPTIGDPEGEIFAPLTWHTGTTYEILFTGAQDAGIYGDKNITFDIEDTYSYKFTDSQSGVQPTLQMQKGNVVVGRGNQLTTDVDGFLYLPNVNGTPTGIPTAYGNRVPLTIDESNSKAWFRIGGVWKYVDLL